MRACESASKAKSQSDLFFPNLICSSPAEVKVLKMCRSFPISTARVTYLKVSGNLNAIQSRVNVSDFRLDFHKEKSCNQRKRVGVAWNRTTFCDLQMA